MQKLSISSALIISDEERVPLKFNLLLNSVMYVILKQ